MSEQLILEHPNLKEYLQKKIDSLDKWNVPVLYAVCKEKKRGDEYVGS